MSKEMLLTSSGTTAGSAVPVAKITLEQRLQRLADLDLSKVRRKLMEPDPEGKGWNESQALEAEKWYRRYLELIIRYPATSLVPNGPIDHFWHAHILDTAAYGPDCEYVIGTFIHHYPYFGMGGDETAIDTAFAETNALYRQHFGEDCTQMNMSGVVCNEGLAGKLKTSLYADSLPDDGHKTPTGFSLKDVLAYSHPDVVKRLAYEEKMSEEDAHGIFQDTLLFLWLGHRVKAPICPTKKIDLGWHIFLFFTKDYREFCQKYFGYFIDHHPRRSDDKPDNGAMVGLSREFAQDVLVKELGLSLSDNWIYEKYEKALREQGVVVANKCCGNCGQGCCKR